MKIIKGIISIILILTFVAGFCLMCNEPPLEASNWEIVKVNGGGVVVMAISIVILSKLNKQQDKNLEQKGGKYYGIR